LVRMRLRVQDDGGIEMETIHGWKGKASSGMSHC
jgi:hypothetical protein